ncbi:MAG: DNA adenine methylase [Acidobacteriota bacterium]|nr:DNA adenine methylase [Acidobacteriota bacterium]
MASASSIRVNSNSPLRYPGGKSCMLDLMSSILRLNGLERGHYAEPYAGGCGLALGLLFGGHVADIHINDVDPSIWAFWYCVLNETEALIEKIETTRVTTNEWLRQRKIQRTTGKVSTLKLAFSTFFLNRTNRSGVIGTGGMIGGNAQTGNYKLDCRYNQADLVRRIRRIAKYKDRIHLSKLDALLFLRRCERMLPSASLFFVDPPYFKKGRKLYTSFYKPEDHAHVAKAVLASKLPWIVTYDNTPEIGGLYRDRRQYGFDVNYSLQTKRIGSELLIASKGLHMPESIKSRQINRPQYRAA